MGIAAVQPESELRTMADLLQRLGGISPERVRLFPPLGTATPQDVEDIHAKEKRLCELVDGVLVEKPMGLRESLLACWLIQYLREWSSAGNTGIVTGEAGMMQIFAGLVRIPDVAFVSWERMPGKAIPSEPVPQLVPDLAVEILSPGNTRAEMARKRGEYFSAGVRLVWEVDPNARTVAVYTQPGDPRILQSGETLSGGAVLPGFSIALADWFAELDRRAK